MEPKQLKRYACRWQGFAASSSRMGVPNIAQAGDVGEAIIVEAENADHARQVFLGAPERRERVVKYHQTFTVTELP